MMAWWDNSPSQSPGAAGWWGGQGFGGFGSPGAVPQQSAAVPQQSSADFAQTLNQAPVTPNFGQNVSQQATPISPLRAAFAGGQSVSGVGPGLWDRLMSTIGGSGAGGFKMPGTTVGAPAGQTPPALPPPPVFPGGPAPPGMGAYFRQQQFPTAGAGGNQNLMMQYLALQQLMRGS